jgi:ATP-dependent Lon protease
VGLYRIEVSASTGTGKLKLAGGVSGSMKESIQRAFGYLLSNKTMLGVAREVDNSDFHVEAINLLGNQVEAEIGVAFLVATYSSIRKTSPLPALVILGDLSIQGNIKAARSLVEPLQVAMDNGAKRVLIPIENKRSFLEVSADVLENVDPIFFGDLRTATSKALGAI